MPCFHQAILLLLLFSLIVLMPDPASGALWVDAEPQQEATKMVKDQRISAVGRG